MATRNFVPRADGEGGIGTSVKQWAGGFFKKLAVGAITTAVTVLTPSADANNQQPATTNWVRTQFKSILEGVLSAAGLKYNLDTNGYICFGSLFGGLILQWGTAVIDGVYKNSITFPIAANAQALFANDIVGYEPDRIDTANVITLILYSITTTGAKFVTTNTSVGAFMWFGIFFA